MPPKGKKESPKKDKKDSPKKGTDKKGSPKKGSPGKKGKDDGDSQPVEVGVQTDFCTICLLCAKTYASPVAIQSHLIIQNHFVEGAPVEQKCWGCRTTVAIKDTELHKCNVSKMVFIDQILSSNGIRNGPPNICLLCRGRHLGSKADLISHLMCYHAFSKKPGHCGECLKPFDETAIPDDDDDLPEYCAEFDKHLDKKHKSSCDLLVTRNVFLESQLRFPYYCPLCGFHTPSNADFHAHILCRHATGERFQDELYVCLECNLPKWSPDKLNKHILNDHGRPYRLLANKWTRLGNITKFVDFAHTCSVCWMVFEYDFTLQISLHMLPLCQAHIITRHTTNDPYVCGWCHERFHMCGNIRNTWKVMHRHEAVHARELHQRALEYKVTEIPLPEEVSGEDLENTEDEDEPDQQGGKGAKKKDGKKGSPDTKKGKTSPDTKKGKTSPDKKGDKKGSPDKKKGGKISPDKKDGKKK